MKFFYFKRNLCFNKISFLFKIFSVFFSRIKRNVNKNLFKSNEKLWLVIRGVCIQIIQKNRTKNDQNARIDREGILERCDMKMHYQLEMNTKERCMWLCDWRTLNHSGVRVAITHQLLTEKVREWHLENN